MIADYGFAAADIIHGVTSWRIWTRLGWQEIRRRYRRTVLGPLWFTFSLGIFIAGLAFVWAPLFHADLHTYLIFVTSGMISWTFVASVINEGCGTYTGAESLVKQLNFPLSILNWMLISRNVIILGHNLVIAVVVILALRLPITWIYLLIIPGIILVAINGVWMSMLLGMLSARYRDVPQLVANLLQVMMFVTPVFWFSSQLGNKSAIVDFNILYHIINVIRAPLLGEFPSPVSYLVDIGFAIFGWAVTFAVYARFRRRIAFWI